MDNTKASSQNQPSHVSKPASSSSAYKPITFADLEKSIRIGTPVSTLPPSLPGPFHQKESLWLAAPLFVVMFSVSRNFIMLSPLLIVVLLACLLFRMDDRSRKIAAIPLTFGGVRLASNLVDFSPSGVPSLKYESFFGMSWVPLLLAACLFYMPLKEAFTAKIMYWESIVLLTSGLIPGDGYAAILAVIHYTLFIAVFIGLIIDLGHFYVAPPPRPLAQPVQS